MVPMSVKDSLLLMVAAVVLSRGTLAAPVSGVTCSLGMRSPTQMVSNGAVLDLRLGETLILNCKGEPEEPGEHFSIHDDYPGATGVIRKNETSLNYTWYIEATENGPVRIFHFDENGVPEMVFELTIQVHVIGSSAEVPTPEPYTTLSSEQTALPPDGQVSHSEGADSAGFQETQRLSDVSTTVADIGKSAVTSAVERYALFAVASVLIILIVSLLVLCFVCIMKRKCRKNKETQADERGQGRTVDVCENGQLSQLSDANSILSVHETSSASISSGQNDHDTSKDCLNQ